MFNQLLLIQYESIESQRLFQRKTSPMLCPPYLHMKTIGGSVMLDSFYLKEESIYGNHF